MTHCGLWPHVILFMAPFLLLFHISGAFVAARARQRHRAAGQAADAKVIAGHISATNHVTLGFCVPSGSDGMSWKVSTSPLLAPLPEPAELVSSGTLWRGACRW